MVFLDGAPEGLDPGLLLGDLVGDQPGVHVVRRLPRSMDLTVTWHRDRAGLERRLPVLFERTSTAGMVWVCWPKKASKVVTDLSDDVVRAIGLELGFVDVKVAAIDQTWSGQKFVRRLKDR